MSHTETLQEIPLEIVHSRASSAPRYGSTDGLAAVAASVGAEVPSTSTAIKQGTHTGNERIHEGTDVSEVVGAVPGADTVVSEVFPEGGYGWVVLGACAVAKWVELSIYLRR